MSFLRWLAPLLATAPLCSVACTDNCSQTWFPFGGSSFLLSSENATWYNAYTKCHDLGGSLASILSEGENEFLAGLLTICRVDKAWIGLTDTYHKKVFTWIEGEMLFWNFGPGEPSGSGDHASEDCVEMRQDIDFKWNDEYCMEKRRFLCRKAPE
ncbi:CD209 antigen-like protein A [Penaeus monodon]|uniref:CD209 antigen-like protein A n=1 Tax=Penaeus monodon TaxID=6687 RepID=UPI0018A74B08|nr:CD209 antigen-like protein A [Penaeus monodon]